MNFERIRLEEEFCKKLESLNKYERSEILRIIESAGKYGLNEPEMLVPMESDGDIQQIDHSKWLITYKLNHMNYLLYVLEDESIFHFEKLEIQI